MPTETAAINLRKIAGQLCKRSVNDITHGGTGGNSRIFKINCGDICFALKFYRTKNGQHRLNAESKALQFFERHGINSTPRLIAFDKENNCSLLEWIEGEPLKRISSADIDRTTSFLDRLHSLRKAPDAEDLPIGTEACFSGNEILRQLRNRIVRLREVSEDYLPLKEFLEKDFAVAVEDMGLRGEAGFAASGLDFSSMVNRDSLTLSPVDFGFHNTLRKKDGNIVFLDFEYFGWADPVNLISDTLQHPKLNLEESLKGLFYRNMLKIYGSNSNFVNRLKILFPLYGLRWCAIILNQFLPDYYSNLPKEKINSQMQALKRASNLLQEIYRVKKDFPYGD
ncbi:phosphotransferase [Candidatus Omnitrophota bacterium]